MYTVNEFLKIFFINTILRETECFNFNIGRYLWNIENTCNKLFQYHLVLFKNIH